MLKKKVFIKSIIFWKLQSALEVISNKSNEINCHLYGAPSLDEYDWGLYPKELALYKNVHDINASMALQISKYFLTRSLPTKVSDDLIPMAPGFKLNLEQALGLRLCNWPGRSQKVIKDDNIFFLDGAHTEQRKILSLHPYTTSFNSKWVVSVGGF